MSWAKMRIVDGFRGGYHWLSNDYPCTIEFGGQKFSSVAAAMERTDGAPLVERIDCCAELLKQKFSDENLRAWLLGTENAQLLNRYVPGQDATPQQEKLLWGVVNSQGKNVLGQLLMAVRDNIRRESKVKLIKETLPPFSGGSGVA